LERRLVPFLKFEICHWVVTNKQKVRRRGAHFPFLGLDTVGG